MRNPSWIYCEIPETIPNTFREIIAGKISVAILVIICIVILEGVVLKMTQSITVKI